MSADFRALCAELLMALENAIRIIYCEDGTKHISTAKPIVNRARAALAEEPAVPQGREPTSVVGQPSDGEIARCLADSLRAFKLTQDLADYPADHSSRRAAELLQRQALVPVPVSERPWEREEWCDPDGLCWLGSDAIDGCTPTWLYGPPAWAERFPNVHRVLLPAHALPLPEVGE